jgi:hypothetical protein
MSEFPAITAADAGCWFDGQYGWHNTYRVCERALDYGWLDGQDDAKREAAEAIAEYVTAKGCSDALDELNCDATDYLQSIAPAGYVFEWDAGELTMIHESESYA